MMSDPQLNNNRNLTATSNKVKTKTERYNSLRHNHTKAIYISLGCLIAIVTLTLIVDMFFYSGFTVTRSFALGAGLNWLCNTMFAKFVFRHTNVQAHKLIVHQMYIGQVIKWVLTFIGFALIFKLVRPISTLAVLIGYISMLVAHGFVMLKNS